MVFGRAFVGPNLTKSMCELWARLAYKAWLSSRMMMLHFSPSVNISTSAINMTEAQIPKRQTAAVRVGDGNDARAPLKEIDVGLPGPNELLVKINWFEPYQT